MWPFGTRIFGFWRGFGEGAGLNNPVTEPTALRAAHFCTGQLTGRGLGSQMKPKPKKTATLLLSNQTATVFFNTL
jgi:hypothetical protein